MAEILEHRVIGAPSHEVVRELREPTEWLHEAAERARKGGQAADAKLRSHFGRGEHRIDVSKRVHLEIGRVQRARDKFVVPVTWEATGLSGLFPVMDAVIEVHPLDEERCRLVFWGRYDPPLGRAGDLIDRFVAHRVAEATVSDLLDAIAEAATAGARAPA